MVEAVQAFGHTILVYVDDELYVAHATAESDAYAGFQHLVVHEVGDLSPGCRRLRRSSWSSATRASWTASRSR